MIGCSFGFFKRKVVRALEKAGFKGDPYAFAECLDMSYEEVKHLNSNLWDEFIRRDLAAFKKENPHEFEE